MSGMIPYSNYKRGIRSMFPWDMFEDLAPQSLDLPSGFAMDVEDLSDAYKITAHLPAVKREEIDVELNEGRLSISVDKKETEEEKEKNYLHKETREWSATRGVYLKDAACEGISAKLADGILTVNVPKNKQAQNVTKIEIE